jgi:Endonuclease/Exonuclease/phosphatase family
MNQQPPLHQQQPAPTFAILPPAASGGPTPHPQLLHAPPVHPAPAGYPPAQNHSVPPPPPPPPPPSSTTTVASNPAKKIVSLQDRVLVTNRASPDEESVDGRVYNREAAQRIRDAWIFTQVRSRQREFTQYKTVRGVIVLAHVFIIPYGTFVARTIWMTHHKLQHCFAKSQALCFLGTWNVNAKGKEEPLDEWLGTAAWQQRSIPPPDIVAVGFQEIVDLNAVNVAVDNKTQQRSQFWVERLRSTLANAGVAPYTLVMQKSMVGLLLCVFVRSDHDARVKGVHASAVGVGVLGMGGNKGGVSIRLQYYDSTLCFVCSHLAAHRENVTGRNSDYANIFQKTSFDIGEDAIRDVIRSGSFLSNWTIGSSSVGLADHDMVFWLGDLNYRIDESLPTETVLYMSEKGKLDELRALDQLNVERKAGRVFENFNEGFLSFPPTYKYQPGTDVYDQRPDKKLRAPAWCDRILWRAQEDPAHAEQLSYGRSETPNISDHKAVYSVLRLTVKDVIQAKREAIYDELMKLLDRYENQSLPMIGLDRVGLDFGPIRYEQSITLPIHITNTGSVVAQYRLVPKPDEVRSTEPILSRSLVRPWLTFLNCSLILLLEYRLQALVASLANVRHAHPRGSVNKD